MRFTIEQRPLTDDAGRPLAGTQHASFHHCDAESAVEAVRLFVKRHSAEVIGEVCTFPGFQAVATVRSGTGVSTLQIMPASGVSIRQP